ncbi:hypothetical protein NN561_018637 [Cricetulus griseus]
MPSAQRGHLEVAVAGEGLAGMGQAGAVPTPALSLGRLPDGGDSAVGRSQTPREGGETRETRGRAAAVSTPGKRHDQQSRRRSCAGPKKQDVVSWFRTSRLRAALGRGWGVGRRGAPLVPRLRPGAQLFGAVGPHPGLRSALGPRDRRVDGLVGAPWCF